MRNIVFLGAVFLSLSTLLGCDKERIDENAQIALGRELFRDPRFLRTVIKAVRPAIPKAIRIIVNGIFRRYMIQPAGYRTH